MVRSKMRIALGKAPLGDGGGILCEYLAKRAIGCPSSGNYRRGGAVCASCFLGRECCRLGLVAAGRDGQHVPRHTAPGCRHLEVEAEQDGKKKCGWLNRCDG